MIVIATNNGKSQLEKLLKSLEEIHKEMIIVDTGSNDIDHVNYLKSLNKKSNYTVTKTPNKNYDTGAYVWAYQNFKSEIYHFLHDSIQIKKNTFFDDVELFLEDYDVVAYIKFNFLGYGDDNWKSIFYKNTGDHIYDYGIFGPMFSIKRSSFNIINVENIKLPVNKTEQTAFEGIWPMIFKSYNLNVKTLEEYDNSKILSDKYDNFTKTFLNRV